MNALTSISEAKSPPEPIDDQKRPTRILTAFLEKETIPHALLFTGIDGVGKKRMATVFAMAVNCPDSAKSGTQPPDTRPAGLQPCGSCRSCRKIDKNTHPDILLVQPEGKTIRIHQIRALIETLSLKPMEARRRFVIIDRADSMQPAAANALLKTLEEPPDRTILILLAAQTTDLLPTIVSRCRHVRFHPVGVDSISERLIADHGVAAEDATLYAAAAGGSYTRAVALKDAGWKTWRDWLLEASGLEDPLELPNKPTGQLLAFAEVLAQKKDRVPEALATMTGWLRDLIVVRHDTGKIVNIDRFDTLQQNGEKLPTASLMAKIDVIAAAQKTIESHGNLRLTLEAMVLRLAQDCGKENRLRLFA